MIGKGSIVYFKRAKTSGNAKSPEVSFKGNGFGIMLGHAPHFSPDVPPVLIFRILGEIGFISFDDVKEFLGEEQQKLLAEKFTDKYWGRKTDDIQKEAAERAATHELKESQRAEENAKPNGEVPRRLLPVSSLLNASGKPFKKGEIQ